MRMLRLTMTLAALTAASLVAPPTASADPLTGVTPWDFSPQNRAAIAVAIRNAEEGLDGSRLGIGGATEVTTIVCGGSSGAQGTESSGSTATATANDSCVIVGQDSSGNQSAKGSSQSSNSDTTGSSIDEVAAALGLRLPQ